MRDLLRLIAFQLGSEVSYEELGKQLGISKTTVKIPSTYWKGLRYLSSRGLLRNLRKEVTKAGKVAILLRQRHSQCHYRGFLTAGHLAGCRCAVGELHHQSGAKRTSMRDCTGSSIWRTYDKQEIDLIEEIAARLTALEFKWEIKCRPHRKPSKKPIPMPSLMW